MVIGEGAENFREWFLGELKEGLKIVDPGDRQYVDGGNIQVGPLWIMQDSGKIIR